ncbi:MAG TPA: hypothetical protein ENI23_08565 [bacterium]|nr:hypothetical protein [bacterium]
MRLKTISEELRKIIKEFKPEEMAVESLFYRTAQPVIARPQSIPRIFMRICTS